MFHEMELLVLSVCLGGAATRTSGVEVSVQNYRFSSTYIALKSGFVPKLVGYVYWVLHSNSPIITTD